MEKLGALRRRRRARAFVGTALVAAAAVYGCSASESRDASDGAAAGAFGNEGGTSPGGSLGGSGGSAGAPLPPEEEVENRFELPVLSGRWVWSANPESGRVAVIDTRTRDVALAQAGFAPTYLSALPAAGDVESAAIVLNARSDDATLMRLRGGAIETERVATHAGANAWAVSPSGRWAIAWSDASLVESPDRAESFQDITVIEATAEPARATRLSVGFRPSRVFVQADEARAFVVTEAGISVVELAGGEPSVSRDVAVTDDPAARSTDVSVVPSGSHAIVRTEGSDVVRVVELESGRRTDVTLSGPVTDLDLVADGSAALVVVRGQPISTGGAGGNGEGGAGIGGAADGGGNAEGGVGGDAGGADAGGAGTGGAGSAPPASGFGPSEIAVLPIPGIVEDPTRFDRVELDELVGSVAVSDDGSRAVLYTTASRQGLVFVMSTAPGAAGYLAPRAVRVVAAVDAVFIAPDAEHALVALEPEPGSTLRGAFAVVSLTRLLSAKIEPSDAPITGVAFGPAPATSALITARTGLTAYLVHLPSMLVDRVALPSLPLAAGVVADEGVGYVAQEHPEGRLSLVNLENGELRTLTGFELAARVRDAN